MLSTQVPELI